MRHLRVVVVDDSPVLQAVLKSYLDGEPDLLVVQTFSGTSALLKRAGAAQPDVVVLDNEMPGGNGVDALPALRRLCPSARVVMWSSDLDVAELALARGAHQFVGKQQDLSDVAAAARRTGD